MDTQVTDSDPDSGRGPDGRSRRIRGLADKTPPDQTARQLDFTGAQDGSDGNGGDDEKFPPDCDPKTLFKKFLDDTLLARIVKCTNERVALLKQLRAIPNMEETPMKDALLQQYAALLKRPPFVKPHQDWPPKVDEWKRLEADELEVWLGVILYMGMHPRPKLSDGDGSTDDQTQGLNPIQMQELTPERQSIVRTCMTHMDVSGRKDGRRGTCKGCKSKVISYCEACRLHLCQRCWGPWHKEKVFGIK
jgi:hypothetical protein